MAEKSGSVGPGSGFEYPEIANGPVERVLAFNSNEHIALRGPDMGPHFSSHGLLTDLRHVVIVGSRVETTFPVDPAQFGDAVKFPPEQLPPFDGPPVNQAGTTGNGFSKQAYFFPDGSSLVTAGPSLPKIVTLKNGGAQFLVGGIGVVAQGTGKYEGVRGTSVYLGSGYFAKWPDAFPAQIQLLRAGFTVLVGAYFKVVFADDQAR